MREWIFDEKGKTDNKLDARFTSPMTIRNVKANGNQLLAF